MYKSKRQKNKSFDWYGLSQRFSIRKYHFGAASVLLGTALILGAAQSTAKAEEATADNKTEAVTSTPKDGEGATSPTNVTLPATEATTGAPVLDKKELSEEEIAKLAAEASKKDDKTSETATSEKSEVADKEKATLVADSTDKKSEKAVDDKADKKDEKKAENPIAATKTILEQLTSEAEVLNTTAANYAEKKVEDKPKYTKMQLALIARAIMAGSTDPLVLPLNYDSYFSIRASKNGVVSDFGTRASVVSVNIRENDIEIIVVDYSSPNRMYNVAKTVTYKEIQETFKKEDMDKINRIIAEYKKTRNYEEHKYRV